jgi:ABC-type uncharacterized transport system involved in gliding motility auxiliary subunit
MSEKRSTAADLIAYLLPMIGGACLLVAIVLAVYKEGITTASYVLGGIGLVLFLSIFIRAERANLQYYMHVFVYSLLVGGICVVGYLFARQYTFDVDLTEQKMHSLSEASRKYLARLDKNVEITVFIATSEPFEGVESLYNRYTDKLTWKFVDPVKEPTAAREFGEQVNQGDIFFKSGDRQKKINAMMDLDRAFIGRPVMVENTFTNAIVDVTRDTRPTLYFLSGHGEVAFEGGPSPGGDPRAAPPTLKAIRTALNDRGILTEELDLVRRGAIPDDATLIVIAGPRRDLFDPEIAALRTFLKAGGKLLILIDPVTPRMEPISLTNVRGLLNDYGVQLPDDLIFDKMSSLLGLSQPVYPMMGAFDAQHPITQSVMGKIGDSRSFLQGAARPLVKGNVPADMVYTELIRSSPESWSAPIARLRSAATLPAGEEMKPQTFAVAVGKQPPPQIPGMDVPALSRNNTRLVAFGSSLFMRDSYLSLDEIAVLTMLNTVNWLTESEEMIGVPSRQSKGTPIVLDRGKHVVIFSLVVILIPLGLFFGGVSYSVVRRRR